MKIGRIASNILCLGVIVNTFISIDKGGISYLEAGLMSLAVYGIISNFDEKGAK